jgi:hypothetical protein
MAKPLEILTHLEPDRFQDVLSASPKRFREEVFRRAGIRAKAGAFTLKSAPKNEVRTQRLYTLLKEGSADLEEGVAEELIRNYLYTRRPMLADALDHFKVPHDNGLTDEDLSFVENLKPEEADKLRTELAAKHDAWDVELYLAFMNVSGS